MQITQGMLGLTLRGTCPVCGREGGLVFESISTKLVFPDHLDCDGSGKTPSGLSFSSRPGLPRGSAKSDPTHQEE